MEEKSITSKNHGMSKLMTILILFLYEIGTSATIARVFISSNVLIHLYTLQFVIDLLVEFKFYYCNVKKCHTKKRKKKLYVYFCKPS